MAQAGFLNRSSLADLLDRLNTLGYRSLGPQIRNEALVYAPLTDVSQLPTGVRISQSPGHCRIHADATPRCFAWANGAQCLKPLTFAARENLWTTRRDEAGRPVFETTPPTPEPLAVLGVRACDLAALALQDSHFMAGPAPDPSYRARRENLLLIAVNCSVPADTCFCASTGDGPEVHTGYDLLLDELDEGFILRVGSERGQRVAENLPLGKVTKAQFELAAAECEHAAGSQRRNLPAGKLESLLFENLEHPYWDAIAEQCLACGNCTLVCPSCFCFHELDQSSFTDQGSSHLREWDSCFNVGHGYIHGLTVRPDTRTRYRQWLTHKLGAWHSQYGRSGCTGCGRCISWCPVGIDLTETVAMISKKPYAA